MQAVTEEKDLGVFVDAELKFRKQAAAAVSKASQIMAVIRRSFILLDKFTLPLLFKMLVRPHLQYGNIAVSQNYNFAWVTEWKIPATKRY